MQAVPQITVAVARNQNTINFAAEELAKYLKIMGGSKNTAKDADHQGQLISGCNKLAEVPLNIEIGLLEDFNSRSMIESSNSEYDDEIFIHVNMGSGIISGNNPRSVLMAVYRFLEEIGCRWLRPGEHGEIIPEKELHSISVSLHERPSYRHRGICIEGAVSLENVLNMIEWLPKLGMNSYFIQFREAYTFFERWYKHTGNPKKEPEEFDIEKARELVKIVETELEKRGLIYHGVGHGWTCEPLGIPGRSWDVVKGDYSPEVTQFFAQVKGERKMLDDIPLNLNLCYSNPKVRELMVNSVLEYLKINKTVDNLHFWLADGFNNQCECENCLKESPSDFYVKLLNELDKALTENNIKTKIVFLLYYDLLWAPVKERIENPDRFIMMFAPITRTYTHSFKGERAAEDIPVYSRNNIQLPDSISGNLGFLNKWRQVFNGDSFDFDYHYMWDHFFDPGCVAAARTIHADVCNLKEIGLDGLISCQCQRAFLPAGLGTYVMAKALWNSYTDFNETAEDYFISAFGVNGDKCFSLLSGLSGLFTPPYMRGEIERADKSISDKYARIKELCDDYKRLIDENGKTGCGCHDKSWEYLLYHREFCIRFAEMLKYRSLNDMDMTARLWRELKEYLRSIEDEIQKVFDLYEFIQTFETMNKFVVYGTGK